MLALLALPDSGNLSPKNAARRTFWPYLMFAFAQGALQIVMQQVRFQHVHHVARRSILLTRRVSAHWPGLPSISGTIPRRSCACTRCARRSSRSVSLLYMFYYYESTGFSYLISRFLEQGLGYPVENTGRLVGVTSLISGSRAVHLLRYSKYVHAQEVDHRAGLCASPRWSAG